MVHIYLRPKALSCTRFEILVHPLPISTTVNLSLPKLPQLSLNCLGQSVVSYVSTIIRIRLPQPPSSPSSILVKNLCVLPLVFIVKLNSFRGRSLRFLYLMILLLKVPYHKPFPLKYELLP